MHFTYQNTAPGQERYRYSPNVIYELDDNMILD
jgi:hypothetical protein